MMMLRPSTPTLASTSQAGNRKSGAPNSAMAGGLFTNVLKLTTPIFTLGMPTLLHAVARRPKLAFPEIKLFQISPT